MKSLALFWSVICAFTVALPASALEGSAQNSFPVQPGATLKIDPDRGSLTVEEADKAEIRVGARFDLTTGDEIPTIRMISPAAARHTNGKLESSTPVVE